MITFSQIALFPTKLSFSDNIDVNPSNKHKHKLKPPPFFHVRDQGEDMDLWETGRMLLGGGRHSKHRCEWMDFAKHVELQSNADVFQRCCHMTQKSSMKHVSLPAPHLQSMSNRQLGAEAPHPSRLLSQWGFVTLGDLPSKIFLMDLA